MLIVGAFDQDDTPTMKVRVSGPTGETKEFVGVVDTGLSGFVALPMAEMVPLRLTTHPAAASVKLGNGTITYNLVAEGTVTLQDESRPATILLDETVNEVLIGMALLRAFQLALIVTDTEAVLHDRKETLESVAQFMVTAPAGQPNTAPIEASLDSGAKDD